MQKLRTQLADGSSIDELIQAGNARSSVYRADQQNRRHQTTQGMDKTSPFRPEHHRESDCGHMPRIHELEVENAHLKNQLGDQDTKLYWVEYRLKSESNTVSSLKADAYKSQTREEELIDKGARREKDLKEVVTRVGKLANKALEGPPGTAFGRSAMESELRSLLSAVNDDIR
jgi:hypothetical protein